MGTLIAAGLMDVGQVRDHNEDNYFVDTEQGLFIVSDGMGGHAAGELASKIVVEVLPALLRQKIGDLQDISEPLATECVLETLSNLSDHVRDESDKHPGFSGMGATVVCALIRNGYALIAYMGDSRAYLVREKHLEQLTKDHTIVQILIDNGELAPEEAATHPARSQITRYVGIKSEPLPEAQVIKLESGDRLLLCSDGLTGMISEQETRQLLLAHFNPDDACRALVDAANTAGGKDNITVVVVNYEGS